MNIININYEYNIRDYHVIFTFIIKNMMPCEYEINYPS